MAEASTSAAAAQDQHVSEDEAALYDRQIRLWGLDAQNRMRQAHILIYHLGGIATETIKNIVLSGVGQLSILDDEDVQMSDLGAGFFFREEDVGKKRVDAALPRIQALNPLVKVSALYQPALLDDLEQLKTLNLAAIVATQGSRAELIRWNAHARTLNAFFYAAAPQGFSGWIFADLGASHSYLVDKSEQVSTRDPRTGETTVENVKRKVKREQVFVELDKALDASWKAMPVRQVSRLKLSLGMWTAWAAWELEEKVTDAAELYTPANLISTSEALQQTVQTLLEQKAVSPSSVLRGTDEENKAFFQQYCLARSQPGEFSPTAAVLGGILAQDLLNALGGREEPLCNWFQLDGLTGNGPTHRLNVPESKAV
ncbi:E1 ubiquitin-activating protein aos1 [Tilletia horrida]|uniref:Ubiquitin-like 1-activating enzyme E1A n=1 Tax=Tilletia horrida TaxID=155126 RepID=A0AAN6GBU3_9BASI|nr:E1 ubiquitin-activating protein aos1 [Tilletia horrida]